LEVVSVDVDAMGHLIQGERAWKDRFRAVWAESVGAGGGGPWRGVSDFVV